MEKEEKKKIDGRRFNGGRREGVGRKRQGRTVGISARVTPEVAQRLDDLTCETGKTITGVLSELIMQANFNLLIYVRKLIFDRN